MFGTPFRRPDSWLVLAVALVLIPVLPLHAQLVGGPYVVQPLDINGGGTTSTGGPYTISASTAQSGGVGTIAAEPLPAPPLYQLNDGFWSAVSPCSETVSATAGSVDCHDNDVCTCDGCSGGYCEFKPIRYGNVDCAGPPNQANLDDILCILAGFANFVACVNGDIHPACTGNNVINLDDILGVLGAFAGNDPCGCPLP